LGARHLTVADVHTYYVLAGATPLLVHNTACRVLPSTLTDEFIVLGRYPDTLPSGWTMEIDDQFHGDYLLPPALP
jgi:hypothetical protein